MINSHQKVIKLLLERGADENAQGGKYGNALQAASFQGQEMIVQLLLVSGANISYYHPVSEGHDNWCPGETDTLMVCNALHAASFRGHMYQSCQAAA